MASLAMAYIRSEPRRLWLESRREIIDVLATAHAEIGAVTGPGPPLAVSKPLAHAYIIGIVSQFQGFARALHELTVLRIVQGTEPPTSLVPLLTQGLTAGRSIDKGNAGVRALGDDFRRLGMNSLDLGAHNDRWSTRDKKASEQMLRLRNALAHDDETKLRVTP